MTENNIDTYMLEDARREVAELKAELKLNASMLARQTDLARVAETESMKLRREVEGLKCCGNCKLYYPECDYRGVLGYYYCDKWQSDGLTRKEREGSMTTDDRKMLTEYLGECWHEWGYVRGSVKQEIFQCVKCGETCKGIVNCHQKQRTFDNWTDFGVLWEWAKKQEWWKKFFWFVFDSLPKDIRMSGFSNYQKYLVDKVDFAKYLLQFGQEKLGWK